MAYRHLLQTHLRDLFPLLFTKTIAVIIVAVLIIAVIVITVIVIAVLIAVLKVTRLIVGGELALLLADTPQCSYPR